MSQFSFVSASFMVNCFVFVVAFVLITIEEQFKHKNKYVNRSIQMFVVLSAQFLHAVVTDRLMWDVMPIGRFLFVGIITYILGPFLGIVALGGNIVFGYFYGFENIVVLFGSSVIYYCVFYLYKEIMSSMKVLYNLYFAPIMLFVAGGLSIVFSLSEANPVSGILQMPFLWVLLDGFFQYILIIVTGYTHFREKQWAIVNMELEDKVLKRTKALKSLNKGLEAEISERRKMEEVLKKAQEDAIHANKVKTDFLANMSHEIRTPINAIMGFNYLLENTQLSSQQKTYLKKANDSSEHLLNVINDILDFTKIEADQMSLHPTKVNLFKILNSVFDNVMYELYQKKLTVSFNVEDTVPEIALLDGNKLQQILLNLMSNAVKFTQEGGITASVSSVADSHGASWLKVKIKDTGIGISQINQRKLFNAFSQVEGEINRRFDGTGLGLSISKSLVELMGGTIYVTSELGEGSEFTFSIRYYPVNYTPNLYVPFEKKVALFRSGQNEKNIAVKHLKMLGYKVVIFDIDQVDEVENLSLAINKFDLFIFECESIARFNSPCLIECISKINSPKNVFVLTNFRYNGVHDIEHHGLVNRVLFYPMGVEELYHHLADDDLVEVVNRDIESEVNYSHVRVLLVEDNEVNQMVSEEILKDKGVGVVVADDGLQAIELIKDHEFDIIFMDIHMPVMDGYEATSKIRNIRQMASVPIIAMTADTMVDKDERYGVSGLTDFILKPINVNEMFAVIERYT